MWARANEAEAGSGRRIRPVRYPKDRRLSGILYSSMCTHLGPRSQVRWALAALFRGDKKEGDRGWCEGLLRDWRENRVAQQIWDLGLYLVGMIGYDRRE